MKNDTTLVEIKPGNLYFADEIFFIELSPALGDIPQDRRIVEDMQIFGQVDDISIKFKEWVQPIFN